MDNYQGGLRATLEHPWFPFCQISKWDRTEQKTEVRKGQYIQIYNQSIVRWFFLLFGLTVRSCLKSMSFNQQQFEKIFKQPSEYDCASRLL